jgi:hypothetical protein
MAGRFTGVSLGAQVAGNLTWAHDLEVTFSPEGISVLGAEDTQANTVPWSAVLGFAPGFTLTFPDGRPATELEAVLADRRLTFLVPAEQLPPAGVADLIALAPARSAATAAAPPASPPPRTPPPATAASTPAGHTPAGYTPPSSAPPGIRAAQSGVGPPPSPYGGMVVGAAGRPKKRSAKRTPVLIGAAAVVVVIAVVAGVLVVQNAGKKNKPAAAANVTRVTKPPATTTTTSPVPAHELSGPPASMSPSQAISDVVVQGSYLKGWDASGSFGQFVAGQQEVEDQSVEANPFFAGESANFEPAYELLQQCTNLPLDHLQLLTGNFYAGGPPTWETALFYPNGANPFATTPSPQLYSEASVVATPAVQESDMAAYAASSFSSCFTSFMTQYLRAALSQDGANVDSLTIERLPVASVPGVEAVEVELNAQEVISGSVYPIRQRLVFMGAGRLEQQVVGFDSPTDQIPLATWDNLVHRLQFQMEETAKR